MNLPMHAKVQAGLLIAILGAGLEGCSNGNKAVPAPQESVSDVSVMVAQKTTVPDWLVAIGTVRAAQTIPLASQLTGNILEISVREGDRVQGGQVLAVIDDAQPRSAVAQSTAAANAAQKELSSAETELGLAEATLKRYQQLYVKKSVSPQEFDEIKARYQSAEARRDMAQAGLAQANAALAQAKTTLGFTRIRAPFAGLVTERKADPGTLALPGVPILTLEDTRHYQLEISVDESDIQLIHAGQLLSVNLEALGGKEIQGRVSRIVPAADAASRSFIVKVELPADSGLRSGLFGTARIARGERSSLLIPQSAVFSRGQLQGVFVVDANQVAGLRYVTLGHSAGKNVEILSGLQEGEKFVASPGDRELGGRRIVARP
jgi:RND family efflux transporter MFP subunit